MLHPHYVIPFEWGMEARDCSIFKVNGVNKLNLVPLLSLPRVHVQSSLCKDRKAGHTTDNHTSVHFLENPEGIWSKAWEPDRTVCESQLCDVLAVLPWSGHLTFSFPGVQDGLMMPTPHGSVMNIKWDNMLIHTGLCLGCTRHPVNVSFPLS